MDSKDTTTPSPEPLPTSRKPYDTPTLTDFGSCTELTQGTFAGVGADNAIYS
jgi:hypothetical protein